ncbi:MAG: amidohydrolase [Actinomycetes bacterium]
MTELEDLATVYQDLHEHPELSFREFRTAGIVAERLQTLGFDVTEGVGRTGVVGVLRNGEGPTVLLRADMDALPVAERTDLPYASTTRATGADGEDVPVMHACGHDMHVTCLIGGCAQMARERDSWRGTLLAVFQPAEEAGGGAQAMVRDGLFERFGRPVIVLGQHVTPLPAGVVGLRSGPAFAAADSLRVTVFGRGGHGSRPESCIDPVVMAAAIVLRLQTVVSREVSPGEQAVVTVGALHAGTAGNIIPEHAELQLTVRSFTPDVRSQVLDAITRIVKAEAVASGAQREPEIEFSDSYPALANDHDAVLRTRGALESTGATIVDPGPLTASEDFGVLAAAAAAPCVYWLLGGSDPVLFEGATTSAQMKERMRSLPSNHSPEYAPVIHPTLELGVATLVSAARTWLGRMPEQ